jgi:hypothetical protein
VKSKVLTSVNISMLKMIVFWDVASCSLSDVY